jgi:DNA-binding NarL/FixJ family response regulator
VIEPRERVPRGKRELEILIHLERGQSNKAIARALGLSLATVKLHVQSILRSTGARNRVEAIANARRMGLLVAR